MTGKELIYVTGATGFVGSHLVERLAGENYRVRALVLRGEDASHLSSLGVEPVRGDVTDPPDRLRHGLAGVTHVFHCAALTSRGARRGPMTRVNVNGLRNVLEASRPFRLKRFVLLSSTVVYGDRDQVNVNESAPLHKTGDSYNYTKVECERMLRRFVRRTGLPAVVLRPPYVYGPGDTEAES
jgi:nucleoside-diphosphate-sugar epimerase